MADDVILVTENGQTSLQAYTNTVSGKSVKAEALVVVDKTGIPIVAGTSLPAVNANGLTVRLPSGSLSSLTLGTVTTVSTVTTDNIQKIGGDDVVGNAGQAATKALPVSLYSGGVNSTVAGIDSQTQNGLNALAVLFAGSAGSALLPTSQVIDSAANRQQSSYNKQITTSTTTTPIATTVYLASLVISVDTGGAGWTLTIQDKQGTPLKLVNALSIAAATTTPTVLSFGISPIVMTSGIDIITTGATPGKVNIFATWWF